MNLQKIEELRKAKNISQEDFAKSIGMSRSGYFYKVNGLCKFDTEDISKIKKVLKLTNKQVIEIFL